MMQLLMASRRRFKPDDELGGLLRAIVESSDDAIIGKELDGTIVSWNAGAARMYGYSATEAVGQPISLIVPDDHREELRRILDEIGAGLRVASHETVRLTRDGRRLNVSLTVSPILDEAGVVVGASAIARDITDARRVQAALRDSDRRYQSIVDSAVDAILVIDRRGRIEAFNHAAERLFGFAAQEVIGQNINMLMPQPYHSEHDGYIHRYLTTREKRIIGMGREVTARRKDGSTFPVHLSVGEMEIDGETKFTGILHDLTARVQLESQLREQAALTRLGEMAAVVAHEVKNPLTGIRGAVQIIGSRLPAGSRDGAVIKEIVSRIDALNELMKDLLLFARPPQPHIAPIDLLPILATVVGLVRQDPSAHEVTIDITGESSAVSADPELLKLILHNLLLNAVHAIQGKGSVRISVAASTETCSITIADSGPGIPPEVREKLFTPFFTTKSRGTGLGLSTARRFAEAQGGSLTIECPPGGGTTALLTLRRADR
ncbi:MAG TPA: PAS domain S-box protein [Vicinamibacterales bacterium]